MKLFQSIQKILQIRNNFIKLKYTAFKFLVKLILLDLKNEFVGFKKYHIYELK